MIALPVLALALFSSFLLYSYYEYQQTSINIEEIRDHYLPLLEAVNDNNHLFSEIRSNFKDAVLASEPLWLPSTKQHQEKINQNFALLKQNSHLVNLKQLEQLEQSFTRYYDQAYLLAQTVINNEERLIAEPQLVQDVEFYHNAAAQQFSALKQSIQNSFRQTVDDTNQVMNQLLFFGAIMAITIMVFLIVVTLGVSLSTRRSVYQVIERMKGFAMGNTDFSQRLQRKNKDELGYLIHWFNKLSDKLEQDYLLLETVSITDKLTQLNNRGRTDSYLPQALADANTNSQQLAVILLDIDHFKQINDNYGHLIGDQVLKTFAAILKSTAREHDFIARWGGEEFIIIIANTDKTNAEHHANHIRSSIEQHKFPEVGQLTASLGVALSNANDGVSSIVKRADDCLYQAKKQGRNQVIVAENNAI